MNTPVQTPSSAAALASSPVLPTSIASLSEAKSTWSQLALVLVISYIAAQMLSDVASLKIGSIAGYAVDMGTFIYPITFTLRDVIHKLLGKRAAQTVIVSAAVANVFMALYLMASSAIASDAGWAGSGMVGAASVDLGVAFAAILAPVWRIVLASVVAEVVSELLDTEIYHWFVTRVTRGHLWARVLLSNAISVPVDSAIFCLIAFYGQMPNEVVWQIFVFNMLVKTALTVVTIPMIYLGDRTVK